MSLPSPIRRTGDEHGFTMIIAIGVMFVTGLLLVAAFTIANGEIITTRTDTTQKQAYYAALAGVQQYEQRLQANPSYWSTCETPSNPKSLEESSEKYEITLLPASTAPKGTTGCLTAKPFESMIESEGNLVNTFRIKSTGFAGKEKRAVVATFKVTGFLDYIYFTNYETEDPEIYNPAKGTCNKEYYVEWKPKGYKCEVITFTSGDSVEGPFHTNDSARVEGTAEFGRTKQTPPDEIEIDRGTYPEDENFKCTGGKPIFNTATKCYVKGSDLVPPESDTSLTAYVESANKFEGQTTFALNGSTNKITVTDFLEPKPGEYKENKETISWPKNGLIFVANKSCAWEFEPTSSDTTTEKNETKGCGNVYVSGTYSKSLTIAAANNVIINGNLYPTSVEGKVGAEPPSSSTAVLGLIATNFVRVYHPCSGGTNGAGKLENPWIYAAILSTSHSFLNDNWNCGAKLGELHVWGAIGQNYRGIVGLIGSTGYIKDYKYDERLATDEPPYFLQPLKAGWKIFRQTAIGPG